MEGVTTSESLAKHLNALHSARKAFIESEANERVRRALRGKVRASEQRYNHGDLVYYKRDGSERWLGPGKVVFQDGGVIFVRHGGAFVRVSPNRLTKGIQQDDVQSENSEPDHREVDENESDSKKEDTQIQEEISTNQNEAVQNQPQPAFPRQGDKIRYVIPATGEEVSATVTGRGGKVTGKYKNWVNVKTDDDIEQSINLDVLTDWSYQEPEEVNMVMVPKHKAGDPECVQAKEEELEKLRSFNTYTEVEDLGQPRISTRWVLWYKGDTVRARLVARGFEEDVAVPRDSPTVNKSTLRIFLAITAAKGWTVKTTDIKSAFLQGRPLDRDVFLTPPVESKVQDGKIWKLRSCLYGLNDAARQFYHSVVETLISLGCEQSSLDPALFYLKRDGILVGMIVSHIDDFLHSGSPEFEEVLKKLRERFLAGKLEEGKFRYVGFNVCQKEAGILLDQSSYVDELKIMEPDSQRAVLKTADLTSEEHTHYRSMVGQLNWAVQGTRPDLAFELIELSTKFKKGTVADLIRAVKALKRLQSQPSSVFFPKLVNPESWKIVVYTDAALANLSDGVSSMGGHIILLVDEKGKCCPLSWHAGKIKRVVRSTIAAEALSLQEGFEDAVYLKNLIQELIHLPCISVEAIIDNKSVLEAVHSTSMVDDKRLRIDIGALKESLKKKELNAVKWCPGDQQLADCLTKKGASDAKLRCVLETGLFPT